MKITLRQLSLKTLKYATAQQVFDKVATHLLKQKEQSFSKHEPICTYKGISHFSGKKLSCAAGCLMKKDEYTKDFEGNNWDILVRRKIVSSNHEELISALQHIHDNESPIGWVESLKELARVSNLSDKALSKLAESYKVDYHGS